MGLEDFLKGVLGGMEEKIRAQEKYRPQPPRGSGSSREASPDVFEDRQDDDDDDESGIGSVMKSVVQIVALKQGFLGGLSSAWTGSGSIVHPAGLILTNCHVADPRAMGMSAPPAERLGIAMTEHSDQPPAVSYFGEVIAKSPELDLAVIRITMDAKGRRSPQLNLPAIEIGDSDRLDLGDRLAIFGYPGIGGETVTYTSGNVSGFTSEPNIRRAWIKTDATIAGGNSGGTSVNQAGQLIGIPTQAAAGRGVTPVDARPVLDTNHDGRVDERDTPMAVGGFINGLRPVNLAIPLLEKAGMRIERDRRGHARPSIFDAPRQPMPTASTNPTFSHLLFSTRVTDDGRPIHPTSMIRAGGDTLYATFEFDGMTNGEPWSVVWMADENVILDKKDTWDDGPSGRKVVKINNRKGLPDGVYHLVLGLGNSVAAEGKVMVGTPVDETDSEVSGQLVDAGTGSPIAGGMVIVLKPGASVRNFMLTRNSSLVITSTESARDGRFTFPEQLPKGEAYGLLAVAQGYDPVAVEGALRVGEDAPEHAELGAIELSRS